MKAVALSKWSLVVLAWRLVLPASAQYPVTYLGWEQVSSCSGGQLFDTAGLTCEDCPVHTEPSADGSTCVCIASYYSNRTSATGSGALTCAPCESGVSSFDRLRCVTCDPLTTTKQGSTCQCANTTDGGAVVAERDALGSLFRDGVRFLQRCVTCPEDTYPDKAAGACIPCPYPKTQISGVCACPAALPPNVTCADQTDLDRIASVLRVDTKRARTAQAFVTLASGSTTLMTTESSAPLVSLLNSAAGGCYDSGNRTACNALANLCVLQLYSGTSTACQLYDGIKALRQTPTYHDQGYPDLQWSHTLPLLEYPVESVASILSDVGIQSRLRFTKGDVASNHISQLTFLLAEYTLEGVFVGYADFTSQLQVCGSELGDAQLWRHVGTGFVNDCDVDIAAMLAAAQALAGGPRFYDIYFVDGADPTPMLYPVPVVIQNLPQNAEQPTRLARRFFAVDSESGRSVADATPVYVVYPSSVLLQIRMADGGTERIKPPTLFIEYAARTVADADSFASRASFVCKYQNNSKSTFKFWQAWQICMGLFCSIAGLLGLLRCFTWSGRQSVITDAEADSPLDMLTVVLGELSFCVGVAVAASAIVVAWHALAVFKGQQAAFLFIMPDSSVEQFRSTVIAAAVLLGWSVLDMIYRQTLRTDYAMVDWEHGKMVVNKDGLDELSAVSCWRSVFLVNEFCELAVKRRTLPAVTFLALVFFVEGLNWKNIALMDAKEARPNNPGLIERSQILSFGLSAAVYLIVVLAQRIIQFVGARLRAGDILGNLEDPRDAYLDLLYFANVSIYIFDEIGAGFYLDGKIKFLHSDTSLIKLQSHLIDSRTGSTAGRGPEGKNQNAFMLFVGRDLHRSYIKEKRKLRLSAAAPKASKLESLEHALKRVANNDGNTPIREPSWFERWFRSVSVRQGADAATTVLACDRYHMWSKTIFYGQEWRLVVFELMLFSAIDLSLRNVAQSASITWFVGQALSYLRAKFGRKCLSDGTFVNELFLK